MDIVATAYTYCRYLIYMYVSNIYMYCHCRYLIYIYVSDMYFIHIHIYVLPLFVYSTLLACWKCDWIDEVACSIYTYCHYLSTQLRLSTGSVLVLIKSLFDTYTCVWYSYILSMYCHYFFSTRLANRECCCVDKVACSMYVYASMDIVATVYTYCCYLIYI